MGGRQCRWMLRVLSVERTVLLCMVCMLVLICVCVRDEVHMEVLERWMWEGVV